MADEKETQDNQENALKQMKLLLMIVLGVALLTPFLASNMAMKGINEKLTKIKLSDESKEENGETQKEELPMAFYKPLEFLVNLGDMDTNHYLRATVSLGVRLSKEDIETHETKSKGSGHGGGGEEAESPEPGLFKTIKIQEPIIRDTVISLISNYTMDDLVASSGKKELKEAIRTKLRTELHNEDLEVYFTAFTLQ